MKKILNCLLLIFIFTIFYSSELVFAAGSESQTFDDSICFGGFVYNVNSNGKITTFQYYDADLDELLISPIPGVLGQSSIKNKDTGENIPFTYKLTGRYVNNGDPIQSQRCFVTHLSDSSIHTGYTFTQDQYFGDVCNSKYSETDLSFIKLSDNELFSEQLVDENTGLITVKFTVKKGSALDSIDFKRIKVSSVVYNDKSINAKVGTISRNDNEKTITISGITPFYTSNMKSDSNPGYYIYLYIDKIYESDLSLSGGIVSLTQSQKNSIISQCGGASTGLYLGYIDFSVIPDYEVDVKNPMLDSSICKQVDNYKLNLPAQSQTIVESYISECYSGTVKYSEITEIKDRIIEKYQTIVDIYSGKSSSKYLADIDKLNCTSTLTGIPTVDKNSAPFETKITYEEIRNYFGMICIESYYVDPGKPSLVLPGQGVDYSNEVEIRKTCSIFNTGVAVKKSPCSITVSQPSCPHFDINQGIKPNGGPSDSFDDCVNECDNGEYTQECVNICNSEVYDDGREVNVSLNLNSYNEYSFRKIAESTEVEPVGDDSVTSCTINGYGTFYCGPYMIVVDRYAHFEDHINHYSSDHGKATVYGPLKEDGTRDELRYFGYAESCNRAHRSCTVLYTKGPAGCVDDPEADLKAQIDAAKNELANFEAIAEAKSELIDYSITFYDSTNGLYYEVTGSSTDSSTQDKPRLIIEETKDEKILDLIDKENYDKETTRTWTISNVGDTINGLSFLQSSVIYDVKLPTSQSLIGSGEPIILKDNFKNDKYYSYTLKDVKLSNIYDKNNNVLVENANLIKFSDYTLTADERGKFGIPGNLYFTAMNSNNVNVIANPVDITEEELAKVDNLTLSVYGEQILYVLYNNINNIYIKLQPGYNGSSKGGTTLSAKFDVADFYCYYGTVCGGIKSCDNSQHYCYYDGKDSYYGPAPAGRKLKDYEEFAKLCGAQATESPICVYAGGKYWGKDGEVLSSEEEMKAECESFESGPDYERIDVILDPDSVPTECKYCDTGGPTEKGLRYYYREIKLTDVFPNDRQPRYNWSASAIDKTDNSYIIDPIALTYAIESKGESIFDDTSSGEVDYEFDITRRLISDIRSYNRGRLSDGSKRTYLDFSIVGKDTNNAYSSAVASWYPELVTRMQSITSCNNAYGSTCDDIGAYVEKVEKTK